MTAQQTAKLNMYNAVISQLQSETAAIDSVPALKKAFNLFVAKVAAINGIAPQQQEGSTGETLTKEQLKKNLVDIALSTASQMFAWASETSNLQVKEQTDLSQTDINRIKDSLLPGRAQAIHDLATANKTALADYGITDDLLQSLLHAIEDYNKVIASPRNKIATRSTQGKNIVTLFGEADVLLKDQIKKLMPPIKKSFPDVFTRFQANSQIVDAPGISAAAKAAKASKAKADKVA